MQGNDELVAVRDLVIRYGPVTAVNGVNLTISLREIVGIIGPNGAGKTSLLSAVAGIVKPFSGSVMVGGKLLAGMQRSDIVRNGVSLVPEGRNIFGSLTVLENLQLGATCRGDRDAVSDEIEQVFGNFPILGERRRQPAGQLSGGEQQMLAISRAMLSAPKLLMLDEPSLGLAPTVIDRVYELLQTIQKQGVAILLVEQNAERVFGLADRCCIMSHGSFTLEGTAEYVANHGDFDAAYFGMAMTASAGVP